MKYFIGLGVDYITTDYPRAVAGPAESRLTPNSEGGEFLPLLLYKVESDIHHRHLDSRSRRRSR